MTFKKHHGEKQDADDFGAEHWVIEVLLGVIKDFEPRNIFDADETGLYWRAIPYGTLCFKKFEATGSKMQNE